MQAGFANFGHNRFSTHALRVRAQLLSVLQCYEDLLEVPALGQADGFERFFPTHQHAQQTARGGTGGNFIAASANLTGLT